MQKLIKVLLLIMVFSLLLTGCSPNPQTDNYGPSWDIALKLPVTDQSNVFGDIVEVSGYDSFSYQIIDNNGTAEIDNFTVEGTETNPITQTLSIDLMPLEITAVDPLLDVNYNDVPVPDGSNSVQYPIDFPAPGIEFGSGSGLNEITAEITNNGPNSVDSITVKLIDNDGSPLGSAVLSNIATGNTKHSTINLDDSEITGEEIELVLAFEQNSGNTAVDLKLSGLQDMKITKVVDLPVSDYQSPNLGTTSVEIGSASEIESTEDNPAEIKLNIIPPADSFNFDFSSSGNYIRLDGEDFTYEEGSYILTGEPITLGTLEMSGQINFTGDTITYDAGESLTVETIMTGDVSFDNPLGSDSDYDFEVDGNDLVFKTEPMEVEITRDDIDRLKNNAKEIRLVSNVTSELEIDIWANLYLSNNKADLFNSDNKLNNELVNIDSRQQSNNLFDLMDTVDNIEDLLTNPPVYMGIEFNFGDFDNQNLPEEFSFRDNETISTEAYIEAVVKVNQ